MFQSTRPVWGATSCAGTRCKARQVSIHAPRVGRDREDIAAQRTMTGFNPRAPCGARLSKLYPYFVVSRVSIHAPRVGRDLLVCRNALLLCCFNPRAPCGARPMAFGSGMGSTKFQSTRPVWGATAAEKKGDAAETVSIHAPRVGRDSACSKRLMQSGSFNPRAPCGARRPPLQDCTHHRCFNPRAPCGARLLVYHLREPCLCFNPRAPCGARRCSCAPP
mgnify:CR=1 FL=1